MYGLLYYNIKIIIRNKKQPVVVISRMVGSCPKPCNTFQYSCKSEKSSPY